MKISNYVKSSDPLKSVVARFDVYDPNLKCTWRDVRLVRSKNGNFFVSLPTLFRDGRNVMYFEFDGFNKSDYEREVKKALDTDAPESEAPGHEEIPF